MPQETDGVLDPICLDHSRKCNKRDHSSPKVIKEDAGIDTPCGTSQFTHLHHGLGLRQGKSLSISSSFFSDYLPFKRWRTKGVGKKKREGKVYGRQFMTENDNLCHFLSTIIIKLLLFSRKRTHDTLFDFPNLSWRGE